MVCRGETKETLKGGKMKEKKNRSTIGYRLDDEHLAKLERLANREGVSVHEKARRLVVAVLNGVDEREELLHLEMAQSQAKQDAILERMTRIEHGTKETFVALFQRLNAATEEEARAFVEFVYGTSSPTATN
jgi:hypothetical protein